MKLPAVSLARLLLAAAFLLGGSGNGRADDLVSTQPNYAQSWQITHLTYPERARKRVFDLAFSTNGTVWLAADDGLRQYDGFTWKLFGTSNGLPSAFIRAVCVDHQNRLWVGSDAGVSLWNERRQTFEAAGSPSGLANPNVREIDEDPDGTLWFSCDQWPEHTPKPGGLSHFNPRSGAWQTLHKTNGLPMDYVIGYFRDSTGRQFAFTPHGWAQRQGDKWGPPLNPGYQAEDCVLQMTEARDGTLFAQGEHTLLILTDGRWQSQPDSQTRLLCTTRAGDVAAVENDGERGQLWFSLWDGHRFVRASGLVSFPAGERLYHLREAPDGSLWCVGTGTAVRWAYRSGKWTYYPHLPPPVGTDVQGRVWFADAAGIVLFADGRFQTLAPGKLRAWNAQGQALIWEQNQNRLTATAVQDPTRRTVVDTGCATLNHFSSDTNGTFWILGQDSLDNGVVAHYENGRTRIIASPEFQGWQLSFGTPLPPAQLLVVANRRDDNLYSLIHVADDRVESLSSATPLPPLTYAGLLLSSGHRWLCGYSGLYEQSPAPAGPWRQVTAFPDSGFNGSLATPRELLVTFTGGPTGHAGCALFCSNHWSRVEGEFSHPSLGADQKTIYLPSRNGVFIRHQPGTLDFEFLQIPRNIYVNMAVPDLAGTLWLGCSDGTFRYQPDHVPPKTIAVAATAELRRGAPLPVTFNGRERFEKTADPAAFHFSWRIDRSDWSPFAPWSGDLFQLPPLPSGRHQLEVRARDADGDVSAVPETVPFVILAEPLQNKRWFFPLVGLVVGLLAWLTMWQVRLRLAHTRQIAATNAVLRREIVMRQQTQTDLEKARGELERRVSERTDQLTRSNRQLRHEISERRQAEEHQRQLMEQLHQSQKMEAIGTLAGGIAHDFNNILAVIIPYGHIVSEELPDRPDLQEHLREILTAANRAKNLVQQILTFSRRQPQMQRQPCQLQSILKEALILQRFVLPSTIQLSEHINSPHPVLTDPTQIHQILMNLCINAQHAMEGRQGLLEVSLDELSVTDTLCAANPDLHPGLYVRITVRDTGCGIPPQILPRIFDPFFTTKDVGKGTGLGLAVVLGIVKNHDGAILVTSQPGQGAEFQILLPALLNGVVEIQPPVPPPRPANGEHILMVDDEPAILQGIKRLLVRAGYEVTVHDHPLAALRDFTTRPEAFHLVLSDLTMPGLNGLEFAARIFDLRPGLPVILATGFAGDRITPEQRAEHPNLRRVVEKPLHPEAILQLIAAVLRETPNPQPAAGKILPG